MKIAFLDIDGVFVPNKCNYLNAICKWDTSTTTHHAYFDPFVVDVMNHVFSRDQNLHGIIHSSWRHTYSNDRMMKIFHDSGCRFRWHPDVSIPDYDRNYGGKDSRWKDISRWLKDHPEVKKKNYIILDDQKAPSEFKTRSIRTDFNDGLVYRNVIKLFQLLEMRIEP